MSKNELKIGFDALVASSVRDNTETVEISTGAVEMGPASVPDVVWLSRDYPSLKQVLLLTFAGGFDTDEQAGQTIIDAVFSEGPEALAALIIVCSGQKKKLKELMPAILDKSEEDFFALASKAVELTMRKDPTGFFGRVMKWMSVMTGMSLEEMMARLTTSSEEEAETAETEVAEEAAEAA